MGQPIYEDIPVTPAPTVPAQPVTTTPTIEPAPSAPEVISTGDTSQDTNKATL